jgi:hypothetical protein
MQLRLIREPSKDGATLGVLFVDGTFECFVLEDVLREQPGQPVSAWKVPGDTAIPAGRYRVDITQSPRFKRRLPLLAHVPGFEGIRIHPGNAPGDTEGCLLPGRVRGKGLVMESRLAFDILFHRLDTATDPVWIDIENPR